MLCAVLFALPPAAISDTVNSGSENETLATQVDETTTVAATEEEPEKQVTALLAITDPEIAASEDEEPDCE